MIISEDGNFIFISNPKTGTSSFQKSILEIDDSAKLNRLNFSSKNKVSIAEHANVKVIENKMGEKFDDYLKIVFVRDIYNKAVSSYYFLINGKPLTRGALFKYTTSLAAFFRALKTLLSIYIARIVPFSVWSLIWPIKKNSDYTLNSKGEFAVNYIAKTESLSEDTYQILEAIGYPYLNKIQLKKTNTSNHQNTETYFRSRFHLFIFKKKYRKEIELYELIKSKQPNHNFLSNKQK